MEHNDLWKLLNQLHDEIHNAQEVDEKGSALLRDLDGDIRALLERSEENPAPLHPTFVQRLEGTLYHFEVSHPRLSTMITRVMDSLSNAGI